MVDIPAVVTTAGPSGEISTNLRPLITRLYQAESRPLKDVIGLLEKDHGFRARYTSSLAILRILSRGGN